MVNNISKLNYHILLYEKNVLIYYNLLIFFIIIYYIQHISKEEDIINSTSKILLTINGTGNQSILSNHSYRYYADGIEKVCYFNYTPDNILVNDIFQKNKDKYVYNLTEQINNITIILNNQIKDYSCIFYGLNNITIIDLSYFNTSLVTSMSYMFLGCSSLISLNLNNFNTSLITDMSYMFYGCSSLISLNLNNINTSLVTSMYYMFSG